MRDHGRWRIGALLWMMQPLYIVLEVVVGARAPAAYSFADSTISDLGDTACRMTRGLTLCSPWHQGMNVGFVYFGCTLALGALLVGMRRPPGRLMTASMIAWTISGLGSIGVGLVPVNENGSLHSLVALPVFLAQPTALLLLGLGLLRMHRTFANATLVVSAASAIGVVGFFFVVTSDGSTLLGATERLELWPGYVWVSVVAFSAIAHARRSPVS